MNPFESIDLQDCPLCHGPGLIQEENGWCLYVECLDCGAHTAELQFSNDDERMEAARRAAHTWNIGKVLSMSPGE